jgi:sugar phosphate permease
MMTNDEGLVGYWKWLEDELAVSDIIFRKEIPEQMICSKKICYSGLNLLLFTILAVTESSRAFCLGSLGSVNALAPRFDRRSPVRPHVSLQRLRHHSVLRRHERLFNIRGGGSETLKASSIAIEEQDIPDERWRRRGMTAALASTYFAVMGAKCALPAVLSLLISADRGFSFPNLPAGSTPQNAMARLLGLSTLAVALGKMLLGPIIDILGGIVALQLAIFLLTSLIITICFTQQFTIFATCWIFVDFIFSSCWASCINAIHQSFPEKEWGRQIGMLAAGARAGNACAFALFASVLYALEDKMKQPWRVVFGVSAILQILPMPLLAYFGRMTLQRNTAIQKQQQPQQNSVSQKSSLVALRREAGKPEFWLHLVSRSCLMVFASFLLFVPTLMSQVYHVSSGFAAQTGSIYALGCLLSVSLGSQLYSKLPKRKQVLANCVLLGTATISSLAQLAHVSGVCKMSAPTSAFFLFLWGFAFSIPFYIPPSLYALSRGGKESSATIADVFDIGGFALLAIFNGYVASIQHANALSWIPTFQITSACSIVSLVSLVLAILLQ